MKIPIIIQRPQQVKALFAFTASIPHSVSFEVGDVFDLLPGGDTTWYKARNTRSGESGFIPINYVEKLVVAAEKGPAKLEKRDSQSAGFSPSDILSVKLNKASRPTPAKEAQPAAQPDALGVKLHPARPRPDTASSTAAKSQPAASSLNDTAASKQPGDEAHAQLAHHASLRPPAPKAAARPANSASATPVKPDSDIKPEPTPAQAVDVHDASTIDAPAGSELHKYKHVFLGEETDLAQSPPRDSRRHSSIADRSR